MRILITNVSFYPANEGGPTNALYWLASGLSKAGYVVRVVSTSRGIDNSNFVFDKWSQLNGFEVIYLKTGEYKRLIKQELLNADVFITCGVCTIEGFFLRMKALSLGKKTIISPRGELFDNAINHKGKIRGYLKRCFFIFMRLCYKNRITYHVTSNEEEDVVKKMMKTDKVYCVPNYMILPDKVTVDKEDNPYFLYVGRLNQIKNIDIIIDGLSKSQSFLNGPYKFKIAGEKSGSYYESLSMQIESLGLSNKVDFLGVVSGKVKDILYANAKCLFLMSKSENFGNVVVEALAQGTPVIASKGTPWQQLCEKSAGWWIHANPDQIAETVNKVLALNDVAYKNMREAAYSFSKEFDIYTNIDKWKEIIE